MVLEEKVDGEVLRAAMRRVPSPVTVVTACGTDEMRGITIGSFTSASLDPPLISFNVEKGAQMHGVLVDCSHYAVHVLGDDQADLSERFARPDTAGSVQFDGIPFYLDERGLPVLEDVLVVFICRPYAVYDAGDHSIFLGEVVEVRSRHEGDPVLYFNRSYRLVGADVGVAPGQVPAVKRGSSDTP